MSHLDTVNEIDFSCDGDMPIYEQCCSFYSKLVSQNRKDDAYNLVQKLIQDYTGPYRLLDYIEMVDFLEEMDRHEFPFDIFFPDEDQGDYETLYFNAQLELCYSLAMMNANPSMSYETDFLEERRQRLIEATFPIDEDNEVSIFTEFCRQKAYAKPYTEPSQFSKTDLLMEFTLTYKQEFRKAIWDWLYLSNMDKEEDILKLISEFEEWITTHNLSEKSIYQTAELKKDAIRAKVAKAEVERERMKQEKPRKRIKV